MIMSNFIDEADRRAELYDKFTSRQRYILEIIDKANFKTSSRDYILPLLHANNINDKEIHWLERTGHVFLG